MAIHLSTPVSALPGIGEKFAKDFKNLGIISINDLILNVPYRYDDFSHIKKIANARNGETVTIEATVISIKERPTKSKKLKMVEAMLEDDSGVIKAIWFNQPYLVKMLPVGVQRAFSGTIDHKFGRCISNPVHEIIGKQIHTGRLVPVYGLTGSLTTRRIREAMTHALNSISEIQEWLPKEVFDCEKLPSLRDALLMIHFPKSQKELDRAIDRLKFDELFLHQVMFEEIRRDRQKRNADSISVDESFLKKFVKSLPFELTKSQKISAWEIIKDIAQPHPMNRLLEGDVGSGKTVVSAIAAAHTISQGGFVVYLAPTEILASQQYQSFFNSKVGHSVALLTHNQSILNGCEVKKSELLEALKKHFVDCLIGTHAVLSEGIEMPLPTFVIVDEQHRFGVEQRHALLNRENETSPHLLSMTATPIPRSLALTIYGDLDLSILKELPKGRKPIATALVNESQSVGMWKHVKQEIEKGRQVFVICPLIDPSDTYGSRSVTETEKLLKDGVLKGCNIETLHGKLKADEKQKRNELFRAGKIQVIVSTTVVEVGVDVPNASVMVILGAEHFGLAQLHQLRGRVGRGEHSSYCYLLPDESSEKSKKRLDAVVECSNGFELAEKDLELRGAGNLFGNAQSGFPDFQFATIADSELMKKTRDLAKQLLSQPDFFEKHLLVRERMNTSFDRVHLE